MEGDFIESIDDEFAAVRTFRRFISPCASFRLHHKDRVFVVSGGGRLSGTLSFSWVWWRGCQQRNPPARVGGVLAGGARPQQGLGGQSSDLQACY